MQMQLVALEATQIRVGTEPCQVFAGTRTHVESVRNNATMISGMPLNINLPPNKLKLPNSPVSVKTRCIGDAEGSENVVKACNRRADVQSDKDDSKMTEQDRQMQ